MIDLSKEIALEPSRERAGAMTAAEAAQLFSLRISVSVDPVMFMTGKKVESLKLVTLEVKERGTVVARKVIDVKAEGGIVAMLKGFMS